MIAYTVLYKRVDLLAGQYALLNKYVPEVAELRVACNGPNYAEQEAECKRLGLTFICTFPPSGMVNAEHHAWALNELWQTWGAWERNDALILDSDMFPFRKQLVGEWFAGASIACAGWWSGLMAISRFCPERQSFRFNPYHYRGTWLRTGGMVLQYADRHQLGVKNLPCQRQSDGSEIIDGRWLHHRDASNWGGEPDAESRLAELHSWITRAM